MKNYIQPGNALTFTAMAQVKSGEGVVEGALFGVATTDAEIGEDFEVVLGGVFALPKAAGALTKGAKAYWSSANGNITGTASGNMLIGAVTEAAAADATTANIRLNGTA